MRPPGTLVLPYAPFSKIFPQAAAIVHQGGIGTCAQALAAGHPMLVVPFAFDQPDNAARLQRLGVARAIPRKHYTARRAYSELKPLLTDPAYAAKAAGAARRIAAENGVQSACNAIENHPVFRPGSQGAIKETFSRRTVGETHGNDAHCRMTNPQGVEHRSSLSKLRLGHWSTAYGFAARCAERLVAFPYGANLNTKSVPPPRRLERHPSRRRGGGENG